jgi:hypothetical protein
MILCLSDYILKAAAARTVARPSADPAASEQSSTSIHQLVMRPPWTTCTYWRSTRRIVDVCRSITLRYLASLIIIDAICTWACCVLLIHATLPVTQHLDRTATYSKPTLKTQTRPWKSWSNRNSLCNLSFSADYTQLIPLIEILVSSIATPHQPKPLSAWMTVTDAYRLMQMRIPICSRCSLIWVQTAWSSLQRLRVPSSFLTRSPTGRLNETFFPLPGKFPDPGIRQLLLPPWPQLDGCCRSALVTSFM